MDTLSDALRVSIVRIDVDETFSGTGFFVAPRRILTCAHVTQRNGRLFETVSVEWRGHPTTGKVIARYPPLPPDSKMISFWPYPDLALIQIPASASTDGNADPFVDHPCVILDWGQPNELPQPDRVFALGFTKGEHGADAIAETPVTLEVEGRFFKHAAIYLKLKGGEVLHGMSGGPVLNLRTGGVCGITESRRQGSGAAGGFVVPFFAVLDVFAPELLAEGQQFHEGNRSWEAARRKSLDVQLVRVGHPHVFLGPIPLCNRDRELEALHDWQRQSAEKIFCIRAPGGQGKSALAWTFFQRLQAEEDRLWNNLIWYRFVSGGKDESHIEALTKFVVALEEQTKRTPNLSYAPPVMTLVVLDDLDTLYGPTDQLIDLRSPPGSTIANPLIEALLRQIIDLPNTRLIITARLCPAFLKRILKCPLRFLELQPLDPASSTALWAHLGIEGSDNDLATATALLHGSPLLIRLACGEMLSDGETNKIKTWLKESEAFLQDLSNEALFQKAVFAHLFGDLSKPAELVLSVLAALAQRAYLHEWKSVTEAVDATLQLGMPRISADQFRLAVREVSKRGLASQGDEDLWEMHELVAKMFMDSRAEHLSKAAYQAVDQHHGAPFYAPELFRDDPYDGSVIGIDSVRQLRASVGHCQSLLRRRALRDALEIFHSQLQAALRFRLGELRVLRSLVSQIRATYVQITATTDGTPLNWLSAELSLHDGRPGEALLLLEGYADSDSASRQLRAWALFDLQRFEEAYKEAQAASYVSLRSLNAGAGKVYSALNLLADKPRLDQAEALIAHALCLRTLGLGLLHSGYRHTAMLLACEATRVIHDSGQPGIESMVYEMLGRVLLSFGDIEGAEAACSFAEDAATHLKVTEHVLAAQVLRAELTICKAHDEALVDQVSPLLAVTLSKGFAVLAYRCLHVLKRLQPTNAAAIIKTAAEQLEHLSQSGSSDGLCRFYDLSEELKELCAMREPGEWMEFRLVQTRVWESDDLPAYVRNSIALSSFGKLRDQDPIDWPFKPWEGRADLDLMGDLRDAPVELKRAIIHLNLSEDSEEALSMVVQDSGSGLPPASAYFLLSKGFKHYPFRKQLRSRMLACSRQADETEHSLALLDDALSKEIDCAPILRDVSTIFRDSGDLSRALFFGAEAHRAGLITRMFTPEDVFVSNILRFGFDALASGISPEVVSKTVAAGLMRNPLIDTGEGPAKPVLKRVGDQSDETEYMSAFDMGRRIYDSTIASFVEPLAEGGTFWWIARIVKRAFVEEDDGPWEKKIMAPSLQDALSLMTPELAEPHVLHAQFAAKVRLQIEMLFCA